MQWMILKENVPLLIDSQAVFYDDLIYGDAPPGGPGPNIGDPGYTDELVSVYAPTVGGDGWTCTGVSWRPYEEPPPE